MPTARQWIATFERVTPLIKVWHPCSWWYEVKLSSGVTQKKVYEKWPDPKKTWHSYLKVIKAQPDNHRVVGPKLNRMIQYYNYLRSKSIKK